MEARFPVRRVYPSWGPALGSLVLACLLSAGCRNPQEQAASPVHRPELHTLVFGPPKAPLDRRPDDIQRTFEQVIEHGSHLEYSVRFDGCVDGVMTRGPAGRLPFHQGFQPNLFVRLENLGATEIVNPWITVNNKRNWRTLGDIVAEATAGATSDREKARLLFEAHRTARFHATTWDRESFSCVKVYNCFGYTLCMNDAVILRALWHAAGLQTRRAAPACHEVAEVYYDGGFHLFDGDFNAYFLRRDNRTVASEPQIVRDHDLIKRTHTGSILQDEDPIADQRYAALFHNDQERPGTPVKQLWEHRMELRLRPGESVEWRWDHKGKEYSTGTAIGPDDGITSGQGSLASWGSRAWEHLCNGVLRYAPDFEQPSAVAGIWARHNLLIDNGALVAKDPGNTTVIWKISSPWVMVGGTFSCRVDASHGSPAQLVRILVSLDGTAWNEVAGVRPLSPGRIEQAFDEWLEPQQPPRRATYDYFIKLVFSGELSVRDPEIVTDVQMAMLSLPELEVGDNLIRYVDETPGEKRVKITHAWLERSSQHPPEAPHVFLSPQGRDVQGCRVRFAWEPPTDPDGDRIVDYHIVVSDDPGLRWPLSPTFDRLLSLTSARGTSSWQVPGPGLLNPSQQYYWRVRAQDATGVWGPWSEVQRFRCQGPGVPVDLRLTAQHASSTLTLSWHPNPVGRRVAHYKVYGSNERGFTASDTPFLVEVGRGFCSSQREYDAKGSSLGGGDTVRMPGNLLGQTTDTHLLVAGPDIHATAGNTAFYRVVGVDEHGNESGSSALIEAPRPFFFTQPARRALLGRRYQYRPGIIASDGDLTCNERCQAAFWHQELPVLVLEQGPGWLSLDRDTQTIQGTPKPGAPATAEVVLATRLPDGRRAEQRFTITLEE